MNEFQKALSNLLLDRWSKTSFLEEHLGPFTSDEDVELMKKLVDKETPMKPVTLYNSFGDYVQGHCPICDSFLIEKQERCNSKECGRVLVWSDEE